MLDVVQDLLFVDVGNAVVLGELLREERLTGARLARDSDFERLEAALLAELVLDTLNVGSEATLAVPVEAAFAFSTASFGLSIALGRNEDLRGLRFNVEHNKALPIQIKIKRRLLGMHGCILKRDVDRLDKASADAV